MGNLFEDAAKMLGQVLPKVGGGLVIAERSGEQIEISATFGKTEYAVDVNGVVRLAHTDRDFIIAAEDYVFAGSLTKPQKGDRFRSVEQIHGSEEVYEVLAIDGSQVYRACDLQGILLRVFTKRIA